MSVTPVSAPAAPEAANPEVAFDKAVVNAQSDAENEALEGKVFEDGVIMLTQTVLMPRMNEILAEASSDEE